MLIWIMLPLKKTVAAVAEIAEMRCGSRLNFSCCKLSIIRWVAKQDEQATRRAGNTGISRDPEVQKYAFRRQGFIDTVLGLRRAQSGTLPGIWRTANNAQYYSVSEVNLQPAIYSQ